MKSVICLVLFASCINAEPIIGVVLGLVNSILNPQTEQPLPHQLDWNDKGATTFVKNQGECYSSYTFAVAAAVESLYIIKRYNNKINLSNQQILECSSSSGNLGCDGGYADKALDYILAAGGLQSFESYPYEPRQGLCLFNYNPIVSINGSVLVPPGEKNFMKMLYTEGPFIIKIDASPVAFRNYISGIYVQPICLFAPKLSVEDHYMLLVGYGTDSYGKHFWKAKNSFGEEWGEKGYIRIMRNDTNPCSVSRYGIIPTMQ